MTTDLESMLIPVRYQLTNSRSTNKHSTTITNIRRGLAAAVNLLQVNKYDITMPTTNTPKRSKLMNSPSSQVSINWIWSKPVDRDENICSGDVTHHVSLTITNGKCNMLV